ncbi:MAG TPA: CbiX/SirB N-terminal domain-containing protein [Actinomycetes bacterium]|nr:CbiX/SirB N-terminal domain-containing protein [Actinomycetes bacterium]
MLAAHGSPDPRHAAVVRALVEDLRADGHDASVGWLDHEQPALCLAVSAAGPRAVVVPLLLADGHHARVDVAGAAGTARVAEVLVPDPGTPDERVLRVLHDRLRESGADAARGVVLAAAGSRGVAHAATCDGVAAALAARLGVPVRTAYASVSPSVADAVHGLRAAGVVGPLALAPLILAPGRLSDQVRSQAEAAGVSFLAEPLGRHPALRDLLLARARAAR